MAVVEVVITVCPVRPALEEVVLPCRLVVVVWAVALVAFPLPM
jgi:hypothetical protein